MLHRTTLPLTVLALISVLTVNACSNDDDAATSTDTQPATSSLATAGTLGASPAVDTYCDAAVHLETTLGQDEPDPDALEDAMKATEASAPAAIASQVRIITEAVRTALTTEDFGVFDTTEFMNAYETMADHYVSDCGFTEMTVDATEYAFTGIPQTTPAGPTVIRLTVSGNEVHEGVAFRIDDDTTASVPELLELDETEADALMTRVGSVFADPGETVSALLDLSQPGRYAIVCFVPEGTTPDMEDEGSESSLPPHFTHGMFAELTIQ